MLTAKNAQILIRRAPIYIFRKLEPVFSSTLLPYSMTTGDVLTTTIVKPVGKDVGDETDLQTLQGLSGRTLIISPDWTNPSGEYRLGIKPAYELFPKDLVTRLKRVSILDERMGQGRLSEISELP